MANQLPVRLSSLTLDGVDLQRADLSVHFDIVSGLNDGLDVRGADTVVPSLAGRIPRSRKRDVRHIILSGTIQGTGASEALRLASWQNLRDELEMIFDPSADVATLVGMALDGTWRQIDVRTQPGLVWTPSPVLGVETVTVLLHSVEPDWQVTGGGS